MRGVGLPRTRVDCKRYAGCRTAARDHVPAGCIGSCTAAMGLDGCSSGRCALACGRDPDTAQGAAAHLAGSHLALPVPFQLLGLQARRHSEQITVA